MKKKTITSSAAAKAALGENSRDLTPPPKTKSLASNAGLEHQLRASSPEGDSRPTGAAILPQSPSAGIPRDEDSEAESESTAVVVQEEPRQRSPFSSQDLEGLVRKIEELISTHRDAELELWVAERRLAMGHARDLDGELLKAREEVGERHWKDIEETVEAQMAETQKASKEAAEKLNQTEQGAISVLEDLHKERVRVQKELMSRYSQQLTTSREKREKLAWEKVEKRMGLIMERVHQEADLEAAGFDAVPVGEMKAQAAFFTQVRKEHESRVVLQQKDLETLYREVSGQYAGALSTLQQRLETSVELKPLAEQWMTELQDMVKDERRNLIAMESRLRDTYEGELAELLRQCAGEYRHFDCELQKAVFQHAEEKAHLMGKVMQLKLALCKWRLDYQDIFHSCLDSAAAAEQKEQVALGGRRPAATGPHGRRGSRSTTASLQDSAKPVKELGASPGKSQQHEIEKKRFAAVQGLVRRLWARGDVPTREMRRLLTQVEEATALERMEGPLLQIYDEEIEKHKDALPLLECAHRRELLLCRLQALPDAAEMGPLKENIMGELDALHEPLGKGLDEYKAKYGEHLMFKGEPYILPEAFNHQQGHGADDGRQLSLAS